MMHLYSLLGSLFTYVYVVTLVLKYELLLAIDFFLTYKIYLKGQPFRGLLSGIHSHNLIDMFYLVSVSVSILG